MSYPQKRLSEVTYINPLRPRIDRNDSTPTSFIGMENVDDINGVVKKIVERPYSEVKKGYTYFEENDVIFAKITPCMQNGKHAIIRDLIDGIGFGSTEFHVIRCSDKIIPEWVHFYLRRKETLNEAEKTFTGAVGQQRVPSSFLQNLEMPVPPVDKQLAIVKFIKAQLTEIKIAREALEIQLNDIKLMQTKVLSCAYEI